MQSEHEIARLIFCGILSTDLMLLPYSSVTLKNYFIHFQSHKFVNKSHYLKLKKTNVINKKIPVRKFDLSLKTD